MPDTPHFWSASNPVDCKPATMFVWNKAFLFLHSIQLIRQIYSFPILFFCVSETVRPIFFTFDPAFSFFNYFSLHLNNCFLTSTIRDIDPSVIRRLKGNDINAFRELYLTFGDRLYHFAFSYLKNSFDAEEIVQEVFIRIWEKRTEIDETRSFKSLIYRMAVNMVFNQLKHQVVKQKYEKYILDFDKSVTESPEMSYHFKELESKINTLLERLPEQQRRIFELSRMQGLSNNKIAEELGLSVRTVENQIYRASRFLKENLKEEYLWVLFCLSYIFRGWF